ncbi:MAG: sulfur carrier protein ThiS [Acidobacteria bacterium]|nr:sulfur carrier protein ThiS [Acidobacteriota bacterium]
MIRVNDESTDHRPGMTVAELLHAQGMDPAIVAVWMDDDLIARDRYDRTLIPDGADVQIVLLASGG